MSETKALLVENLSCPYCGSIHRDIDDWALKPHKTHLCCICLKTFEGSFKGVSNPAFVTVEKPENVQFSALTKGETMPESNNQKMLKEVKETLLAEIQEAILEHDWKRLKACSESYKNLFGNHSSTKEDSVNGLNSYLKRLINERYGLVFQTSSKDDKDSLDS